MIFRNRDRGLAGRRSHELLIVASAIIFGLGGAVQGLCQNPEAEARLRERIGGFWTAMQRSDFGAAAEYIHPDSRDTFRDRVPKGRSGEWKIDKLGCNKEVTACETVVLVRREIPFPGAALDWPMHNTWVVHEGQWYLKIAWQKDENPFLKMFKDQDQVEAKRKSEQAAAKLPASKPKAPDVSGARFIGDISNPTVLHYGEKGVFRFRYTNMTNAPFRIVSAVADCACTGVRRDGYPEVAPGETGIMEVMIDSFGQPLGPIDKEIRVQFSDLKSPMILHLGVENRPNFVIDPARIEFGELKAGVVAETTVKIRNNSGRTVNLIGAINVDPRVKISIERKNAGPGEEFLLVVRYDPAKPGVIMDALSLRFDLDFEPLVNIPVRGKVIP